MSLGLWLAGPVFRGAVVTFDFLWYLELVQDYLAQTRSGMLAPLIGQTEFLWNGYSQARHWLLLMLVWVLDMLTGARLSPRTVLSMVATEAVAVTPVMAYLALVLLRPHGRWISAVLAALYAAGPGVLAASHFDAAVASMLVMPLLPLAMVLSIRLLERPGAALSIGWGATFSAIFMANPFLWFWLAVLLGFVFMIALIDQTAWQRRLAAVAAAGLVFAACSAAYLVQIQELDIHAGNDASATSFFPHVAPIDEHIRRAFAPLPEPLWPPPQQLGYSLWLVLGLSGVSLAFPAADRSLRWFLPAILVACIVPLFEIPWLAHGLARLLPEIAQATWPVEQRVYPVLTAAAAVAGALARPAVGTRRVWISVLVTCLLCAGIVWSLSEADKLVRFERARSEANRDTFSGDLPEYAPILRYSLDTMPGYAPPAMLPNYEGVGDPALDDALLDANGGEVISNFQAVRQSPSIVAFEQIGDFGIGQARDGEWTFEKPSNATVIKPLMRFVVEPEKRYVVVLEGTLERGFAFLLFDDGIGGRAHRASAAVREAVFALWTSGSRPVPTTLSMDLNCLPPAETCRYVSTGASLREYDRMALPVAVRSLLPYRASVADGSGLWLETHRSYVPGYRARVNGEPQDVARSPRGRAMIPLIPGANDVSLDYEIPRNVVVARWISIAAWGMALVFLAMHMARRFKRRIV